MTRSFSIVAIYHNGRKLKFNGGRYLSSTPASAAGKAFSQACRHTSSLTGSVSLDVHIRESTQGSAHKTYSYRVSRVKTQTHAYWLQDDINFMYKTKVKSI